jgi:hypothetical protein
MKPPLRAPDRPASRNGKNSPSPRLVRVALLAAGSVAHAGAVGTDSGVRRCCFAARTQRSIRSRDSGTGGIAARSSAFSSSLHTSRQRRQRSNCSDALDGSTGPPHEEQRVT